MVPLGLIKFGKKFKTYIPLHFTHKSSNLLRLLLFHKKLTSAPVITSTDYIHLYAITAPSNTPNFNSEVQL